MLLLTSHMQSLQWEDLTNQEQINILNWASGRLAFCFVLRHGYCSTIAFQKKKGRKLYIKEVERYQVWNDEKLVADYLWFTNLSGWRTCFHEKKDDNVNDKFLYSPYDYFKKGNEGPGGHENFTHEEFKAWIREKHRYFDLKGERADFFMPRPEYHKPYCFLRKYMENLPNSEFFCKAGYPFLAVSKRICGLQGKKKKQFLQWLSKQTDKKALFMANQNDVYTAGLQNLSFEELEFKRARKKIADRLPALGTHFTEREIYDYMTKKAGIPCSDIARCGRETLEYFEYLRNCQRLGHDLNDKGTVMPRNYAEAVANASAKTREKENKRLQAPLKKFAKELGNMVYEGGIEIKPLKSSKEFIEMGNYFHNCVGRMNYDGRMSNRKCYIVIVYLDGKPNECVEIEAYTNKIRQEFGLYNCVSKDYNLLHPFVEQYANTRAYA